MKKGKRKKKTLGRFRSNNIGFVPKIVRIVRIVRRGVIGLFFSGSDGGITKKKKKVDVDPRKESYKRVFQRFVANGKKKKRTFFWPFR